MFIKEIKEEVLGTDIRAILVFTDDGITVTLVGGTKPHVGAVSIVDGGGNVNTTTFFGHKENSIAQEWAIELHRKYHQPVVVSVGIHYDNLSKTGIEMVVTACNKMLLTMKKDFPHKNLQIIEQS